MYVPRHFSEPRVDVLQDLVREHPFGALITLSDGALEANHIPWLLSGEPAPFGTLRGHVARANPVWRSASTAHDALVLFQGPDAYISPNWYPSKRDSGRVVPTWNYVAVHACGPLRVIEEPAWLIDLVTQLSDRHEAGQVVPWHVGDAPEGYIEKLASRIVGLEIVITRLTGKRKLSQNRPAGDREGVIAGLDRVGIVDMAALVRDAMP